MRDCGSRDSKNKLDGFSEVKSMGEVEGYWGGSVGGMEEENYSEEMAFPRN
jgi:hypothetical protein